MKILSAEFVTSAVGRAQFPSDSRPQIAFAGRSNVGKSSLINALVHRKNLVKTSSTPGKTQLINFFLINDEFYFVDLPGYGYAATPKSVQETWAPLIEGYLQDAPRLRAVVVLLDCRREFDERDMRMLEWLAGEGIPAIPVLTKADKLNRQEIKKAEQAISARLGRERPIITTSAKSGSGIDTLRAEITRRLTHGDGRRS